MKVALKPEDQKFIDDQVKAGRFASAEEVVGAALERLRHDECGEFEKGELNAIVAEGEADVQKGALVDGEEVFGRLRRKTAEYRQRAASNKH